MEVRIDPANTASQRAALGAGFTPAEVVSPVAAAGETSEDLRFVLRPH